MKILIFFVFLNYLNFIHSSNILGLFPHPGFSHFKVFFPILKELAKRGHNITVVTYIESKINLHNYHEIILEGDEDSINVFPIQVFEPSRSMSAMLREFWALESEGRKACLTFYNSGVVDKILNTHSKYPFDLVIMENFNTDCYFGLPYILNVPTIGLSSCALMPWHYDRVALPDSPSFIPSEFVGFSERMTFSERLVNFIVTKGVALLYRFTTEISDNRIIKEKLNIDIDVRDIAKQTSLLLVNQHYSLSGSRPLPSRVIEIGGIHIEETTEKLPIDIETFLENSNYGVIFISWGSMLKASSLETEKVNAILEALDTLPENVLWKWESDEFSTKSKKFKFIKWAPQKQLLCHPKVKLFWAHGGLLGVSESVYCGKPLIVTPIYGDQFLNGRAVENRRMGKILLHDNLNVEEILNTFKEISKPEYLESAKYVSDVYRNRQNSPLETALWWIEHVLNYKGSRLSYSPAVELSGFVYYSLDVVSVLIFSGLLIISFPIYLIFICCRKSKHISVKLHQF